MNFAGQNLAKNARKLKKFVCRKVLIFKTIKCGHNADSIWIIRCSKRPQVSNFVQLTISIRLLCSLDNGLWFSICVSNTKWPANWLSEWSSRQFQWSTPQFNGSYSMRWALIVSKQNRPPAHSITTLLMRLLKRTRPVAELFSKESFTKKTLQGNC